MPGRKMIKNLIWKYGSVKTSDAHAPSPLSVICADQLSTKATEPEMLQLQFLQ